MSMKDCKFSLNRQLQVKCTAFKTVATLNKVKPTIITAALTTVEPFQKAGPY